MNRFSVLCLITFSVGFIASVARAETCGSAIQKLNALEKIWSNKSPDPEKNQVDGSKAVFNMNTFFSAFDKTTSIDDCRPSLFRSLIRTTTALMPFDFDSDGPINLEKILHQDPTLQPVFESTLREYMNEYSGEPRVSCRAQWILRNVKAQHCNREHKNNCFNQGPQLAECTHQP